MTDEPPRYAGGVGSRREAREQALGLLYEAGSKDVAPAEVLATQAIAPHEYAVALVEGVAAHSAELDERIAEHSRNWRLDRMPTLDLLVLRLGAFELLHRPDVPPAVTLNEMVELAKLYSTADSGRFVNGVLSAIADGVAPTEVPR